MTEAAIRLPSRFQNMDYYGALMETEPILSSQSTLGLLRWYIDAGVDELAGPEPVNRFQSIPPERQSQNTAPARPFAAPAAGLKIPDQIKAEAEATALSCQTLAELEAAVRAFDGGALKQTAANTVFADGNPNSPLMFIDDIPGPDEDRQGKPLAGENGKLMDKILAAIGLDRNQVYMASILFWRPPGKRPATAQETAICLPFVKRHIELAAPKLLVFLGGTPANLLLGKSEGIARLRGKWTHYAGGPDTNGPDSQNNLPVMTTYHPSHLLLHPDFKRDAWHDFLEIDAKLKSLTAAEAKAEN
jgi:uracil-DNA glycosylase family 4